MYVKRNIEARSRTIVVVQKQYVLHISVCVWLRARACVGMGARAMGRACKRVALLIRHAKHPYSANFGLSGATIFFDIIS